MNQKQIINKLIELKEGIICGALWGIISVPAALSLSTIYTSLTLWQKLLILPTYLAGFITKDQWGWPVILIPILIGAGAGAVFDHHYRPGI